MKKNTLIERVILLILAIFSTIYSANAQEIVLGYEISKTCVNNLTTVSATIIGEFAPDNQLFIEFYSNDGSNLLLYSERIEVINNQIKFTYPATLYDSYKFVNVKIRATNPALFVYNNNIGIKSKPIYSIIYNEKTIIESRILNKNDIVELPFKLYNTGDIDIETVSGLKFNIPNESDMLNFSLRDVVKNTGLYGIKKATNFCGTSNFEFGYNLSINSERFKLKKTEQTEFVCSGNKFVVDMQTDNILPDNGVTIYVDITNSVGQTTGLTFTRNKQQLLIDIPDYQQEGEYTLKVNIVEKQLLANISIFIKNTPTYIISGTYNVKYGESFLISEFNAPYQNNFNYEYLSLFLNGKTKLEVNQQKELKYNFPKETGTYYLTGGYSSDLSASCKSNVSGSIQVNVKPSIKIETISNEVLCKGQDFFLKVSCNQELLPSYTYKVRLGKYATNESFSFRMYYYSTYEEVNATWVSSNMIKFSIPLTSTFNTKPAYFISVVANDGNIEGIIYPNQIRILEIPNINFVNTTYNIYPSTYQVNYTTNTHIGWVKMSDNRTYPFEEYSETGQENTGFIRSMAYQSGTYYPVKAWNQCGNGTVSGSYIVNNTNPSQVALLFTPLKKKFYCVGDTVWLDWIKNGNFNSSNKFYVEFSETSNQSMEILPTQKYFIVSNTSSLISSLIRIKSTSPEVFSSWRDFGTYPTVIDADISMRNVQYGTYYSSFDTVTINKYTPVVFYGHDGIFRNTANQIIPFDIPISFNKDTLIKIAQVSNGCVTQPFNKTLKINYRDYLCNINDIQVSCNKSKTLIRLKYYFYGDFTLPIRLAVQFRNPNSSTWTTITTRTQYSDEIWAELNSSSVNDTYCYLRLVSLNNLNLVIDILSMNYSVVIKKFVPSYQLTSEYGNNILATNHPFEIILKTIPTSENNNFNLNAHFYNISGGLNMSINLFKDEVFSVTNAFSDCGFVDIIDTVKVKFFPQLTAAMIVNFPCKSTQIPLGISYQVINSFPAGTVLKFYLSNEGNKYYIGEQSTFDGYFYAVLPPEIPIGTYELSYESVDGIYTKILNSYIVYEDSGKARIIEGTINKYYDDPFYIPLELKDGYSYYNITLNISDYVSYPIFDYKKIILNDDGLKLGSILSTQTPPEVFITSLITNSGYCESEILDGKLKVNYLSGNSNRIYASIILDNSNLPIKCLGTETILVKLSSQGYFNSNNQFIPQLSDFQGLNFTDVSFTQSGDLFTITLPNNLPIGEGYRFRFRSTSPVEYGASSNTSILIKPRPSVNLTGNFRINEGQSITIASTINGTPPFSFTYNDGLNILNQTNNSLNRVITPIQDFNYSINSIEDKYCLGSSTGSTNVVLNCLPNKQLTVPHVENRVYKAQHLKSSSVTNNNLNIKYRGGKSIILEPGFKVNNGSTFSAEMNGCN